MAKESGVQEGKLGSSWDLWKLVQKRTLGCKAFDEERSGVKRRCRPFNHTAE